MKQKRTKTAALSLSLLLMAGVPASAQGTVQNRALKYIPSAVACLSMVNLPGVTGAGMADLGAYLMEYDELTASSESANDSTVAEGEYLTATEEDWENLEEMLAYCEKPLFYESSSDYYNKSEYIITADVLHNERIYQFFFGTDGFENVSADEVPKINIDKSYNLIDSTYNSYPEENVRWILQNIFGLNLGDVRYTQQSHLVGGFLQWFKVEERYYGSTFTEYFGRKNGYKDGYQYDGLYHMERTDDDTYVIICKYLNPDQFEIYFQYTCVLHYTDGVRYWKFIDGLEVYPETEIAS